MKLQLLEKTYISLYPKLQFGLKKYVLSDFSYGEFLIYKNEKPYYYLDILNEKYHLLKTYAEEQNLTISDILKEILDLVQPKENLNLDRHIFGIELTNKERFVCFELVEFPSEYINNFFKSLLKK